MAVYGFTVATESGCASESQAVLFSKLGLGTISAHLDEGYNLDDAGKGSGPGDVLEARKA